MGVRRGASTLAMVGVHPAYYAYTRGVDGSLKGHWRTSGVAVVRGEAAPVLGVPATEHRSRQPVPSIFVHLVLSHLCQSCGILTAAKDDRREAAPVLGVPATEHRSR